MTTETDDPLDTLEVGETQRVELTEEHSFWFNCPDEFVGFDRNVENIDVDTEIVFDENGEEQIRTTYSADVTRNVPKLPYWWDDGLEMDADGTLEREKPPGLAWRALKAGAFAAPLVIATAITEVVMRGISGEMTMNGEPVVYEPWTSAIFMAVAGAMVLAIRELRVHNYLNVTLAHQVRGGNPTHETFLGASRIEAGGGGPEPDYVTEWVANELWHEHGIDLETSDHFDIEVVDVEAEEVLRL